MHSGLLHVRWECWTHFHKTLSWINCLSFLLKIPFYVQTFFLSYGKSPWLMIFFEWLYNKYNVHSLEVERRVTPTLSTHIHSEMRSKSFLLLLERDDVTTKLPGSFPDWTKWSESELDFPRSASIGFRILDLKEVSQQALLEGLRSHLLVHYVILNCN